MSENGDGVWGQIGSVRRELGLTAFVLILFGAYVFYERNNPNPSTAFDTRLLERVTQLETEKAQCQNEYLSCREQIIEFRLENGQLKLNIQSQRTALNQLPFPVWITSIDGRMEWFNRNYSQLYLAPRGYTNSDYLGQKHEAVWPPDMATAFSVADSRVFATGETDDYLERVLVGNFEEVRRYIKIPMKENGRVVGLLGLELPESVFRLDEEVEIID